MTDEISAIGKKLEADVLEAYEQLAERFSQLSGQKIENAYIDRPATLSLLPSVEGKTVLEAGCGAGHYSQWLEERGARVIAVDASPKMVRLTRRRLGPTAQVRQANLREPLDFLETDSIDLVVCPLVVSYIEDLGRVYEEFYRVLRSDGVLVVSLGHPWGEYRLSKNENYFETELLSCEWQGFGEPYVDVPFYRRSLEGVVRPLFRAGFLIEDFLEPRPVEAGREIDPETFEKLNRNPSFLSFRAVKRSRTHG